MWETLFYVLSPSHYEVTPKQIQTSSLKGVRNYLLGENKIFSDRLETTFILKLRSNIIKQTAINFIPWFPQMRFFGI